jgi:hypothetical protein
MDGVMYKVYSESRQLFKLLLQVGFVDEQAHFFKVVFHTCPDNGQTQALAVALHTCQRLGQTHFPGPGRYVAFQTSLLFLQAHPMTTPFTITSYRSP